MRTSTASAPSALSSWEISAVATACSSDGAVTSNRLAAASAVTVGSATGTPARSAARSCSGQRARSRSIAEMLGATTVASAFLRSTTRRSIAGTAGAASSQDFSSVIARWVSSSLPMIMIAPLCGSRMRSSVLRLPAGRVSSSTLCAVSTMRSASALRGVKVA